MVPKLKYTRVLSNFTQKTTGNIAFKKYEFLQLPTSVLIPNLQHLDNRPWLFEISIFGNFSVLAKNLIFSIFYLDFSNSWEYSSMKFILFIEKGTSVVECKIILN